MRYGTALSYFALKPGSGLANLAYGSLCVFSAGFVPFLGQIVLLGYLAEVAEDLDRHPKSGRHDDFTFDRFTNYLSRGLYPFLVQLLLAVIGCAALLVGVGVAVGLASEQPLIGVAVGVLGVLLGGVAVTMLSWPATLHAQLSGGLDLGANMAFSRDFLGRVGWDTLGVVLAFVPISLGVALLGMMACFVGIYPASVVISAARQHLLIQLYHRYLDAGGEVAKRGRWGGSGLDFATASKIRPGQPSPFCQAARYRDNR